MTVKGAERVKTERWELARDERGRHLKENGLGGGQGWVWLRSVDLFYLQFKPLYDSPVCLPLHV